MKRIIILTAFILAGCGGGPPVAYRPIVYGENNQCYYVNNPAEVVALQAQGLCQTNWAPTLMPSYWHQRYYPYYSSPAYYNIYVPVASRSVYAASEKTWGSLNESAITTESKKATYQGSNGKIVPADKIGATKYGSGARFGPVGTKFGGGSARTPSSPQAPAVKAPSSPSKPASPSPKSPSYKSPSGGSKSYGGGSGRLSGGSKSYGGGGGRR